MPKHTPYHFLTITLDQRGGKHLVTLPGQRIGREDLSPNVIVKDIGPARTMENTRRNGNPGDIFFTTTLRRARNCYAAREATPLSGNEDIFHQDAALAYRQLQESQKT